MDFDTGNSLAEASRAEPPGISRAGCFISGKRKSGNVVSPFHPSRCSQPEPVFHWTPKSKETPMRLPQPTLIASRKLRLSMGFPECSGAVSPFGLSSISFSLVFYILIHNRILSLATNSGCSHLVPSASFQFRFVRTILKNWMRWRCWGFMRMFA